MQEQISKSSNQTKRVARPVKPLDAEAPRYKGTIVEDELTRHGGALLAMLSGRAQELGHNRGEMSQHLGVTYGYIAQLTSGHRKLEHISMEFADACTRYLGVPKMTVLMAAGVVKPEDILERPNELTTVLPQALQFISRDPDYGPLMPRELLLTGVSAQMQYFIVRLYEAAAGRKFIPGEHSLKDIADTLRSIQRRREELTLG
jgi:hypothetical protein